MGLSIDYTLHVQNSTQVPIVGRSFGVVEKKVLGNRKLLNDSVGKISRKGNEIKGRKATPNCEQSWETER